MDGAFFRTLVDNGLSSAQLFRHCLLFCGICLGVDIFDDTFNSGLGDFVSKPPVFVLFDTF